MVVQNTEMVEFSDEVIIIFTKYPVAGKVKTRLIPDIGESKAAELQRKMTEYVLTQARKCCAEADIVLAYSGAGEDDFRVWLGADLYCYEQGDGDLGQRMAGTFRFVFDNGAERAVLLGCDAPDNRAENIDKAFAALDKVDYVFGPANDGGYYLVGMKKTVDYSLFEGIEWSTGSVLADTLAKVDSYRLVKKLGDVDWSADIPGMISVVIPALNEEENIARAVLSVGSGFNTECIVVDGGSVDKTTEHAAEAGALVLSCGGGRAAQMNCGASDASGKILVFLHADSELLPGWDIEVRRVLSRDRRTLGAFAFRVRERIPLIGVVEKLVWLRSKIFKRPYGDQAFFLETDYFNELGCYPREPILEDLSLVRKAAGSGRIVVTGMEVITSARRWVEYGVVKTTLLNQAVLLADIIKVDRYRLRDCYRKGKNPLRLVWEKFAWKSRGEEKSD